MKYNCKLKTQELIVKVCYSEVEVEYWEETTKELAIVGCGLGEKELGCSVISVLLYFITCVILVTRVFIATWTCSGCGGGLPPRDAQALGTRPSSSSTGSVVVTGLQNVGP